MTERRKRTQIFCNAGFIDALSLMGLDLRDIHRNTQNRINAEHMHIWSILAVQPILFGRENLNGCLLCTELNKFHCSASCDLQIWHGRVIIGLRLVHLNLKSPIW